MYNTNNEAQGLSVKTIAVCGAGTMGIGIAQVAASSGFNVWLFDLQKEAVARAEVFIKKSFADQVNKKRITETDAQSALQRLRFTSNIEDCVADLAIEAIIEDADAKISLLNQLQGINNGKIILASNTSSLSITALQHHVVQPNLVAGMHFFNPATHMKLVEVIKGKITSPEVLNTINQVVLQMKKVPVQCIDTPGFIVNRVARPYYLEALRLLEEGVAGIEDIDTIMEATGFKLGPFKLMDLIGIDINYNVSEHVYHAMHQAPRMEPSALQKQKVEQKKLGRKSGEGFYKY